MLIDLFIARTVMLTDVLRILLVYKIYCRLDYDGNMIKNNSVLPPQKFFE
jgi:hypothetical protein